MPNTQPNNPNLEQLKKQAKDLRQAHKNAVASSAERIGAQLNKYAQLSAEEILAAPFSLRQAQQVIAAEQGFSSWQKLREHWQASAVVAQRADFAATDLVDAEVAHIHPVAPAAGTDTPTSFLVFLSSADQRGVVIGIGDFEGKALLMMMRRRLPPRPLPHGLLHGLLRQLDGHLTHLVIHSIEQSTFYARLFGQGDGKPLSLDCRPSDGMVLASQYNIPLKLTKSLLAAAGRPWTELERIIENSKSAEANEQQKQRTVNGPQYQGDFRHEGADLHTTVIINPWLAALGGQIQLNTLGGKAAVEIAADKPSGTSGCLKGQGLPQAGPGGQPGDLYYRVQIEAFLEESPLTGQSSLSLSQLNSHSLTPATAIDAIKRGQLKAFQLPRTLQVRIREADLRQYLKTKKT